MTVEQLGPEPERTAWCVRLEQVRAKHPVAEAILLLNGWSPTKCDFCKMDALMGPGSKGAIEKRGPARPICEDCLNEYKKNGKVDRLDPGGRQCPI